MLLLGSFPLPRGVVVQPRRVAGTVERLVVHLACPEVTLSHATRHRGEELLTFNAQCPDALWVQDGGVLAQSAASFRVL